MAKQLTAEDRFYIHKRLSLGESKLKIARDLGVHHTTIYRETLRNLDPLFKGEYNHLSAERICHERKVAGCSKNRFSQITEEVEKYIISRLLVFTSPKVISGEMKVNLNIAISKNTIYRYVYANKASGGNLYKSLPHSGNPYNHNSSKLVRSKIIGRVGIEQRPVIANLKLEPGHFEMDTIFGYNQESFLLTLTDKATKAIIIRKLKDKKAETVVSAIRDIVESTLYQFTTITSDNGTEFAYHQEISMLTGASYFFADPYSSWQRGLIEHTNGLIRKFFPKGTDFNTVADEKIAWVEHILNTRSRESLQFKSPNQVMLQHLMAA